MKTLITQIAKFGVVGIIAFIIDFAVMNASLLWLHTNNLIAGLLGFSVSIIFNFLLSMKFVFKAKKGLTIQKQAVIFLFTAVIGLIINEIILWLAVLPLPAGMSHSDAQYVLFTNIGKIISVIVVAIWNFIARKKLLEEHDSSKN